MIEDICIVGSGGFGREVRCLIDDINQERRAWNLIGFVNTDRSDEGEAEGVPVLSMEKVLARSRLPAFALGLGHPQVKARVLASFVKEARWPNLVHPSVIRSSRVTFAGQGIILTAGNVLTTNILINDFAMLNLCCTVGHDVRLGAFTVVSPGVNISGYVTVGEGSSIGTGAKIIEGKKIGEWSVIGAGAVVTKDIPDNSTAVGVPASVIKSRESGWHLK